MLQYEDSVNKQHIGDIEPASTNEVFRTKMWYSPLEKMTKMTASMNIDPTIVYAIIFGSKSFVKRLKIYILIVIIATEC